MSTSYAVRTFGSVLLITQNITPTVPGPAITTQLTFRDGVAQLTFRQPIVEPVMRDGTVELTFRG